MTTNATPTGANRFATPALLTGALGDKLAARALSVIDDIGRRAVNTIPIKPIALLDKRGTHIATFNLAPGGPLLFAREHAITIRFTGRTYAPHAGWRFMSPTSGNCLSELHRFLDAASAHIAAARDWSHVADQALQETMHADAEAIAETLFPDLPQTCDILMMMPTPWSPIAFVPNDSTTPDLDTKNLLSPAARKRWPHPPILRIRHLTQTNKEIFDIGPKIFSTRGYDDPLEKMRAFQRADAILGRRDRRKKA